MADSSSVGGTGNGDYGFYILRPDGLTDWVSRPVEDQSGTFDCELKAGIECVIIKRQQVGNAMPGVVIFTHCPALVQTLADLDPLIIICVFNAKVGTEKVDDIVGKHGLGIRNERGCLSVCIVASKSALRSAGTLLSQVRAPPLAPWPDRGSESLR
ncbi:hypothetical protein PoB_002973000 [Plakobranchus ocellatus]|uniref:Uncharacterized protein n=1 Tax=Plakobranchus ocellatus TaxID=259542 RepID=A0AAV4A8S9_9GAST|nr:hypothetical protein PoB_002973000 [Plakobranchus ocellatus]